MQYTTSSAEETKRAAAEFATMLKGGELVLLIGDLGAGKTTFTQGLVAALGSHARVKSPTFTVMNEYPAEYRAIRRVVHIDLYRFHEAGELRALALDDERRPDTVIVMEWPNILPDFSWQPTHTVTLRHGDGPDTRTLSIE